MLSTQVNAQTQPQSADSTTTDSLSHATRLQAVLDGGLQGNLSSISDSVTFSGEYALKDSIEVFGWHPYWNGNAYKNYNFSLLSTIAYFSYELDPKTGSYKTIHDWKTTSLIDTAKAVNPNAKVLLSVTNFGKKNNREFLGEFTEKGGRQQALIDSLEVLLAYRKADGVAIDFESVGRLEKKHLTNFITLLSTSLKAKNKDYVVYMAVPADDPHEIYDVKALAPAVDKFIVMSYGYYWSKSKKAGPVAPLVKSNTWGGNSVATTVEKYQKLGLDPAQTIIGVPYYGELWDTKSEDVPSKTDGYVGSKTYEQIRATFSSKPQYNLDSNSAYYSYKRSDTNGDRQLWFEDAQTIAAKYDWINQQKLGGIGIWALGDDDGYTDLWEVIADKFASPVVVTPEEEATDILSKATKFVNHAASTIVKKFTTRSQLETPKAFLILTIICVIVFPIGFFVVPVKLFVKKNIKIIYAVLSLILIASLLFDKDILIDSPARIPAYDMILLLIATATLGILLANLMHSILLNKENLP